MLLQAPVQSHHSAPIVHRFREQQAKPSGPTTPTRPTQTPPRPPPFPPLRKSMKLRKNNQRVAAQGLLTTPLKMKKHLDLLQQLLTSISPSTSHMHLSGRITVRLHMRQGKKSNNRSLSPSSHMFNKKRCSPLSPLLDQSR